MGPTCYLQRKFLSALTLVFAAVSGLAISGCAGSAPLLSPPGLSTAAPASPEPQPAAAASDQAAPPPVTPGITVVAEDPVGSATELYSRVARGAMSCWFGPSGPLKREYIYHAEADAPSRGGKALITIHQRDPTQPNPRGAKTYKVDITPTGESSAIVKTENLRMTDAFAAAMSADVGRWAKGDQGCAGASTAIGWASDKPDAPAETDKHAKKSKTKTAAAKTKPSSKSSAGKPTDQAKAP